jgi:dihydroorotate dehydrogenase (NAD+) catalytic subunit
MIEGKKLIKDFLETSPVPVIVSVFATSVKDFETFAREYAPLNIPLFELNLSCPNVEDDMGKALGGGCASASSAVKAVKKIMPNTPILAKLAPNVANIADVAKACEQAGADGIVAVNTYSPSMLIDIRTRKPTLGAKFGGLSGPAVFPMALNAIYNIYGAVKIPVIGMGGVTSWQNTVEMMMAGATLVGVGSATYFKGLGVFEEIKTGLREYMAKEKIKNLKEIVGVAH